MVKKKIFHYSLLCIFSLLIVGGIGIYIATEYYLPYSPIRPYRITRDEIARVYAQCATPAGFDLKYKTLDIIVEDTLQLKGWFIFARTDSVQGTIVLLHGIGSCKEAWLPIADTLARNGFNSVLFDLRAHGESGGMNCTFGYYEKYDVSAVINETQKRIGDVGPYAVFGHSLGASIAVQAMAVDSRIVCGIAQSPFATLREILHDYWRQMSGISLTCIPDAAIKNTELIAHFTVDSVRPENDARFILHPMMIIHGVLDKKISIEYGKRVYNNLQSPEKEWYPIEKGDHDYLSEIGGKEYYEKIIPFFHNNIHRNHR
jgi:uncharacterized protein